jgi:hypothetical protein
VYSSVEFTRSIVARGIFDGESNYVIITGDVLADMIVPDQDILTIDPDHIMDPRAEQTRLGGKLVYAADY